MTALIPASQCTSLDSSFLVTDSLDVSFGNRFPSSPDSGDEDANTFRTFLDCLQHIEDTTKARKIAGSVQKMAINIHSSWTTIASDENFVSSD